MSKKLIFDKTFMKFTIAMATPKIMDKMNEQLLEASDFKSKSSKLSKIRPRVTPLFNNKTVCIPLRVTAHWLLQLIRGP